MAAAIERPSPAPGKIIVGVDFSDRSTEAARWVARHLAPDATIDLVHVLDVRRTPRYLDGPADRDAWSGALREEATARLDRLAAELPGRVDGRIREGRPHRVLRAMADEEDAELVVVAASSAEERGRDGEAGRTAARLVDRASHPLLLARGSLSRAPRHVLVAVDDSPETAQVLSWARRLRRADVRLTVLHVFQPVYAGVGRLVSGEAPGRRLEPEQREQAEAWLRDEASAAGLEGQRVDFEIAEGDPEEAILEAVRRHAPDLLVLGSHGAGAVERAFVGSTAAAVARAAPCSVLLTGNPREGGR